MFLLPGCFRLRLWCFIGGFGGLEGGEFLHQAAFAAGSVVFVYDASFRGFIESADRLQDGFF